jgi:hypothetical protein
MKTRLEVRVRYPSQIGNIMDFATFVRKPFVVEAVEVTTANIAEVAKYVGDLREKEDGTPYILVDRRLVPNVFRVYPGFFMTKMGENVRCYSRKIFKEQFTETDEKINAWVEFMNTPELKASQE